MKRVLSDEQIQDLIELHAVAVRFDAPIVIIGAVALACFLDDLDRFTSDVDLVIALDLRDLEGLTATLASVGWRQEVRREHRWTSSRGSIIDLLPAGPKLRAAKQVIWPVSKLTMSLVGFDHAFSRATSVEFAPSIHFNVAPLAVIALLKMVAHLDDPYRRAKDLIDLKLLMNHYEARNDRIFCDEVFIAELEDIDQASAFLLGLDICLFATREERDILRKFIDRYRDDELFVDAVNYLQKARFQRQLRALEKGLRE